MMRTCSAVRSRRLRVLHIHNQQSSPRTSFLNSNACRQRWSLSGSSLPLTSAAAELITLRENYLRQTLRSCIEELPHNNCKENGGGSSLAFQVSSFSTDTQLPTKPPSITETKDLKAQLDELLDKGSVLKAQVLLDRIEATSTNIDAMEDCRLKLLDGWIQHQNKSRLQLKALLRLGGNDLESDVEDQSTTLLKEVCHAAECANNLLEVIDPFFSARHFPTYDQNTDASQSRVASDNTTEVFAADIIGYSSLSEEKHEDQGTTSTSISQGCRPNTLSSSLVDIDLTCRCDDILTAWSEASRASYNYSQRFSRGKNKRWTRAMPQRAQFLLERMEASFQQNQHDGNDIPVKPTVESYNRVIETWAYSGEHLRGAMAEKVFQKLQDSPSARRGPNGDSYKDIIRAWAFSDRDRKAAFTATRHLMQMLRKFEHGDEDMEPTLEEYYAVLEAWVSAEDKMSPGKAESVLRLMDYAYDNGFSLTQPDEKCYKYVLLTAAQKSKTMVQQQEDSKIPVGADSLGPLVDDILFKMKGRLMVPDSDCYGAAIETFKNCALIFGADDTPHVVKTAKTSAVMEVSTLREWSVKRTLGLLAEMRVANQRSTSVSVRVRTNHFNDAIEALTVSSDRHRTQQADQFLKYLEEEIDGSDESLSDRDELGKDNVKPMPNLDTYRLVLNVWNSSNACDRVPQAKALLWRMRNNCKVLFSHASNCYGKKKTIEQVVEVFNSFVNVCASSEVNDEEEGMRILGEALAEMKAMPKILGGCGDDHLVRPNSATYAALLEACKNLLPIGKERGRLVEMVFRMCCDDGMVNDSVLKSLKDAASSDLYTRLVVSSSANTSGGNVDSAVKDEKIRAVPEAWTINALGGKVVTSDGNRAPSLSIEGRLTVTKAMQDFKMRRIRSKKNQNLLRGGRLKKADKIVST